MNHKACSPPTSARSNSRVMLDAARKGDWDHLVTLEKERGIYIERIRMLDRTPCGTQIRASARVRSSPRCFEVTRRFRPYRTGCTSCAKCSKISMPSNGHRGPTGPDPAPHGVC